MSQPPAARRTTSLQGSSRLALSVGKANHSPSPAGANRHPLKHEWSISYVHRPPGTKVEYEKEIKRVATFGSIESFLQLYSHLTPANELQPVTDVLVFLTRIQTPGVWECMPDGGKFTLRLQHPITPVLFESLLFALIGDQFEEEDRVVGCVLSARQSEDLISVWVEEEGEGLKSGVLREKILSILNLPAGTACEYRSNRALLDAAATMSSGVTQTQSQGSNPHQNQNQHHHQNHQPSHQQDGPRERSYPSNRSQYRNQNQERDRDGGEDAVNGTASGFAAGGERGQGRYTRGSGFGYIRERGNDRNRNRDREGGEEGETEGASAGPQVGGQRREGGFGDRRFGSRGRGFRTDQPDTGAERDGDRVERGR